MARRYANPHDVRLVRRLIDAGLNNCQIARATGVSRPTIREWRRRPTEWPERRTIRGRLTAPCPRCDRRLLDEAAYAYLLGLYLGDGTISKQPKGSSYRLRIKCADAYPGLIVRCKQAMAAVKAVQRPPGVVQHQGCVEVNMSWSHWPCLFPQHGPGRKHQRPIRLVAWQKDIIKREPERLLSGLIHSDGWRGMNKVTRRWGTGATAREKSYRYPRYQFSNNSEDILAIFTWACDLVGVQSRRMTWNTISIARSDHVSKLDSFIDRKR